MIGSKAYLQSDATQKATTLKMRIDTTRKISFGMEQLESRRFQSRDQEATLRRQLSYEELKDCGIGLAARAVRPLRHERRTAAVAAAAVVKKSRRFIENPPPT